MNKTTSGFKGRKNDHQVIHRNQQRFIQNYTHGSSFVPWVNFTQFNPTPTYHKTTSGFRVTNVTTR